MVIAPDTAPQNSARPRSPGQILLDSLDEELVRAIRLHGFYGEHIWKVLTEVAANQNPTSRDAARALRRELWDRLKRLLLAKIVFRHRRSCVTASKLPILPRQRRRCKRRRIATARRSVPLMAGSTIHLPRHSEPPKQQQPVQFKPIWANSQPTRPAPTIPKTKSAPAMAEVFAAASALARLPRKPMRRWTGWLHGMRLWRGALVELPSGRAGYVYGILRGQVVILKDPESDIFPPFDVFPAEQIKLRKNPTAVVLGKRKRGVRERESAKKRLACQRNGCLPTRPGNRPRGRPSRTRL